MIKKWAKTFDQYFILKYLIKWFFYIIPVSVVVGSMVAFFLWLLDLATALTLNADGTMSGALTGNWSYDVAKKQLKLGNVIVCVEREVDWEATPRRVTLVYAGTEKNLNTTYWGKKVK